MLPSLILAILSYALAASATSFANASDTFASSDGSVSFSLNVPTDSDDLYFILSGPISNEWIAVGLGSNKMAGALILMAYGSSNGSGATLSPRTTSGHIEPSYDSSIDVEILAGSGIQGANLIVNGRCTNCRSWYGGSIDTQSTGQNMIFASGRSSGIICSDSLTADTRRHSVYGVFTMDLTKASGPGALPPQKSVPVNINAVQASLVYDKDIAPVVHACLMILAFLGFMPFGLIMLRLLKINRLHGLIQFFGLLFVLVGFGVGIYCGTMYNRTKQFNSAHQIFGLLIIIGELVSFVLGYLHYRILKRTESPITKLRPVHVWLGRIVIPAGIINGYLGFPLALNPNYDYILAGLTVVIGIPTLIILLWKARRRARKEKSGGGVSLEPFPPNHYPSNAWNQPRSNSDSQPSLPSASYLPPYNQWSRRG